MLSLLILSFLVSVIQGFVAPTKVPSKSGFLSAARPPLSATSSILNAAKDDAETDKDEEDWNISASSSLSSNNLQASIVGPEKNQMYGFISDFLSKENGQDFVDQQRGGNTPDRTQDAQKQNQNQNKFTHLIAIPMGSCHELSIELESVQRAILYHCPVLVHSCLVSATTRLPLLYVHQKDPESGSGTSPQKATELLHQIVQETVQRCFHDQKVNHAPANDNANDMEGVNADGIRPLTLTFQSLEVDGKQNEALHTVALSDDPGTMRLQSLVADLQSTIVERLGWETSLPPDEHITETSPDHPPVFRPRVPFMRIPRNFQDYLEPLPDDRDELTRTSQQGGNGISPIFWATWWDDVFGMARLRDIAIYPRTTAVGLAEDAFHMPAQTVALPLGNAAMTQQEAKFETYQEQRMKQAEYDVKNDLRRGKSNDKDDDGTKNPLDESDPMFTKTRARLETLYQQDILEASQDAGAELQNILEPTKDPQRPIIDETLLDEWTRERIRKANAANGIITYEEEEQEEERDQASNSIAQAKESQSATTNDTTKVSDQELDDWTRERIRRLVESREYTKTQQRLAAKKDKVAIQDNPVFRKFKDGTLVPESEKVAAPVEEELAPFPSREQFVGFWKVLSSPTGFDTDEDGRDDSKSENLVLRVDGTTAGGPILDPQTNQKAAGGTWKITPNDSDGTADLRIRLVIPPEKERILVMDGKASKRALLARLEVPPMTSSAFGIPALEDKLERSKKAAEEDLLRLAEEKIMCTGKVWMEDATTRKNKVEIGEFSLVKLNTPRDPSQYTITIPRPVRTQD